MSRIAFSASFLIASAGLLSGCGAEKGAAPEPDKPNHAMAGYWTMDDTLGGSVGDATGNGHAAKIIGRPSLADGVAGKALSVSGSGMGLDVPDHPVFAFRGGFTVTLSFRIAAFPSPQGFLFFRGDSRMGNDPIVLTANSDDNTIRFAITGSPDGSRGDSAIAVSARVEAGRWYRADAVFDTTGTNSIALYRDGVEVGRRSTTLLPLATLDPDWYPSIGIGHHGGRTANDYVFNGQIDEVRFFAGALSPEDIAAGRY